MTEQEKIDRMALALRMIAKQYNELYLQPGRSKSWQTCARSMSSQAEMALSEVGMKDYRTPRELMGGKK